MSEIVIHSRQVEMLPLAALKGYDKNARTHPDAQIAALVNIMRDSGFTNPILIDDDDVIVGGHGRAIAAAKLKMTEVPCVRLSGLTPDQIKAIRLSDNATGLASGWDDALLRVELADLQASGFDLSLTGFSSLELTGLFSTQEQVAAPDDAPPPPANPVSVLGDIWLLGDHRIMCGDSLDIAQVRMLLNGVTPELANCDPPYGINIVKGASDGGAKPFGKKTSGSTVQAYGNGGAPFGGWKDGDRQTRTPKQGRERGPAKNAIILPGYYDAIIGDDTTDTAVAVYHLLVSLGVPAIALWGGNYFANHLPPSRCWLVWDKETNGNFADAELAWTNQDKVVKILKHQWSGLMKASERGQRRVHPTQKPVALAEWVADTISPKARTVLDLFLGSGSVLIAAQNRNLTCFGMEMAPAYIDVAVARWEAFCGGKALLAETGETFDEVKARRLEVV
jgi:DNA modification methylase